MTGNDPLLRVDSALRRVWDRARTSLAPPPLPDYAPAPPLTGHELWLRRLDRIRATLEEARGVIARDGFTGGAWFTVASVSGGLRPATLAEAYALRDPRSAVASACLVGTLLRLAADPDRPTSSADVASCVDELYEAMHEQMGHAAWPAGRVYAPADRTVRLRALTAWNDAPGRAPEDLLDLLDRAISRTMIAACRS